MGWFDRLAGRSRGEPPDVLRERDSGDPPPAPRPALIWEHWTRQPDKVARRLGVARANVLQRPDFIEGGFLDSTDTYGAAGRRRAYRDEIAARGCALNDQLSVLIKYVAALSMPTLVESATDDGQLLMGRLRPDFPFTRATDGEIDVLVDAIEAIALSFSAWNPPSAERISVTCRRLRSCLKVLTREKIEAHDVAKRLADQRRETARIERARKELEAAQRHEAAALKAEQGRRAWLAAQPANIAAEMERCVNCIDAQIAILDGELTSAERFLSERAFSPFWEEIENMYASFAAIRSRLDRIADLANSHTAATQALEQEDWFQAPRTAPVVTVGGGLSELNRRLQDATALVSAAQRDFEFAQIWELRRNTAAVVTGFGSLESAVRGMRGAMITSFAAMSASLQSALQAARQSTRDGKSKRLSGT